MIEAGVTGLKPSVKAMVEAGDDMIEALDGSLGGFDIRVMKENRRKCSRGRRHEVHKKVDLEMYIRGSC